MRRKSLLLCLMFMSILGMTAHSNVDNTVPHRKVYGFFLRGNSLGGYGFGDLYLDNLQACSVTYPYKQPLGVYAGACANGVYYACEYTYNSYGPPTAGDFISYDLTTGEKKVIGKYAADNNQLRIQDMTYDYSSGTMYAVGFESGNSMLYTFNLETGARTPVATLAQKGVGTLAADLSGNLYTIGQGGTLMKINKETGEVEALCETNYQGMLSHQTMEFDNTTGMLYWASCTNSKDGGKNSYMIRFNLKTSPVEVTELGMIGDQCNLLAMYIPFVKAGEDAPASLADITIKPADNGMNKAIITWVNPTKTFGGKDLSDIKSISVMRDGKLIATLPTSEIGGSMSYEDASVPNSGEFRYTLYATNSVGDGEQSNKRVYIGFDAPAKPNDIAVQIGEGCKSAVVQWAKPQGGFHGGYFTDEGLTYKVIRFPDSVVVGQELTETSFTDQSITSLGRYYYKVYACNPYGETGAYTQASYVLGSAVDAPILEEFNNEEEYFGRWTTVDGNDDNYSWVYNSPYGAYQFGDDVSAAEYIVNPGVANSGKDADEWIITPPINFEKSKTYVVKLKMRAISDEKVVVTLGSNNAIDKQQAVDTIVVKNKGEEELPIPMAEYEVKLPVNTDGVNCVGVHLISQYPQSNVSHLQIGMISIEEGNATGITEICNDQTIAFCGRSIDLGTDKAEASLYALAGYKVAESRGRKISLAAVPSGIYILKVKREGKLSTIKIHVKGA